MRSIVDECDRLNRYTTNLLELSKLQAGVRPNAQVIDVGELIGVAVQRVRPRAGKRTIRIDVLHEPLLAMADAALFEIALVNVLGNAITYSEDESIVLINASGIGKEIAIDVRDQGVGIPDADLDQVFHRFHRVVRFEAKPKGSGLGLAIAKGFVEAFDGEIWAETPGIGSCGTLIAIRLPAADVALTVNAA